MISSFRLKFGRVPGMSAENITSTPVTVFVGPNNSGKSKLLREIAHICRNGQPEANAVLLDELTFEGLSEDDADSAIERLTRPANPGMSMPPDQVFIGSPQGTAQVPFQGLKRAITNPSDDVIHFCRWFLIHFTLILDGHGRINLINQQVVKDLQQPPQSSFHTLFRDDAKRQEVRRIVADAFGLYFVLDPTNLGHLRIRLASTPPVDDLQERGIHEDAVRFHNHALPIEESSDGVKAFTGIIAELIAGDPRVLLIDEPEAFLHPSLAAKLGLEVSRAALETNKRLFVSTHSPTFVMGCIQSGAPVNIVRLTYRDQVATARLLPSTEILELMRNPLLRSTGVLSGLFYEFVVVTESDSDRAFYQEINERLLLLKPEWGVPNCLFLNAQNKQTIRTILQPLRKLGIPAAAIVDVDALNEGGANWTNLLQSAYVPEASIIGLATQRASLKKAIDATGKDIKRQGGISILQPSDQESARSLLGQLQSYGIFVVPGGELECWLPQLGASGHGPSWLVDIFEKMGEDPDSSGYVRPGDDDVWLFVSSIKDWLINSERTGIPS